MYDWLTARGIAPERLHLENRSTSTAENFAFSLPILSALNQGQTPLKWARAFGHRDVADFLERKRAMEKVGNDESKSPRRNVVAGKTPARWLLAADAR